MKRVLRSHSVTLLLKDLLYCQKSAVNGKESFQMLFLKL